MNIELKDFQELAAQKMLRESLYARREALDERLQAIVLSSPTGSGKTVTVTALMERIIEGDASTEGDPDATFLWLSDSPELNEQSRQKLAQTSSVFRQRHLEIVSGAFDEEVFAPGKVYFLNTQKLGKDKNLVTPGDNRTHTIWQTIRNTAEKFPSSFHLRCSAKVTLAFPLLIYLQQFS